jgi:hypothetical protein
MHTTPGSSSVGRAAKNDIQLPLSPPLFVFVLFISSSSFLLSFSSFFHFLFPHEQDDPTDTQGK